MANQDVELIQSFVRKYINRAIREHFSDISGNDDASLSLDVPRQAIKRVCLHKDTDPIMLTAIRLLFWWIEAKGLLEGHFYMIPSNDLHETQKFKPQIKLLWREDVDDARANNRYPISARYSVRWKGEYQTTNDINKIRLKINNIFNKPTTHNFWKGRIKYSYYDDEKGYRLLVTARDETEAKDVINKLLEIQNDNPLNE